MFQELRSAAGLEAKGKGKGNAKEEKKDLPVVTKWPRSVAQNRLEIKVQGTIALTGQEIFRWLLAHGLRQGLRR